MAMTASQPRSPGLWMRGWGQGCDTVCHSSYPNVIDTLDLSICCRTGKEGGHVFEPTLCESMGVYVSSYTSSSSTVYDDSPDDHEWIFPPR